MRGKAFAAYVLVDVGAVNAAAVRDRILEEPDVILAHALIGPNDLIVYVEVDTHAQFIAAIDREVRHLIDAGLITRTETMPVLGDPQPVDPILPDAISAWVLCTVDIGDPRFVVDALRKTTGVVHAHAVLGRYDILCRLKCRDSQELMDVVDRAIRATPGIRRTDTRYVLQGDAAPGTAAAKRSLP
jgi:DNA-binding Lrp family transcriptional regulator